MYLPPLPVAGFYLLTIYLSKSLDANKYIRIFAVSKNFAV